MTNIIAAIVVCVVTNVTMTDNEGRVSFKDMWFNGEPTPGSVIHPATERTETTEAVEIKRLTFEWEGETYTATRKRVLWSKVRKWAKKEEWTQENPNDKE